MNLFTRKRPYLYVLKYLIFLLKHPVYWKIYCSIHSCVKVARFEGAPNQSPGNAFRVFVWIKYQKRKNVMWEQIARIRDWQTDPILIRDTTKRMPETTVLNFTLGFVLKGVGVVCLHYSSVVDDISLTIDQGILMSILLHYVTTHRAPSLFYMLHHVSCYNQ